MDRFYLIKDLYEFLKHNKKWWLIPLIIFVILLGLLIYFTIQASITAVPIFIYPLA